MIGALLLERPDFIAAFGEDAPKVAEVLESLQPLVLEITEQIERVAAEVGLTVNDVLIWIVTAGVQHTPRDLTDQIARTMKDETQ